MPKIDRSNLWSGYISDAWKRLGAWERISMVNSMAGFMLTYVLPDAILEKFSMGKKYSDNKDPIQITKNIWQIMYWGYVNSTVIKGKDGTLLLHSCPTFTKQTILDLKKLGPVGAIVVPSIAHDEYAHAFKEKFPEAKVYCPEKIVEEIKKGLPVEGAIEHSKELENYGIQGSLDCDSWCVFHDCFLKIKTETLEGKSINALLSCCGIGNTPRSIFTPIQLLLGFEGLRIFRQFALLFTKDMKAARDYTKKVAAIPNVDLVVFQHGVPLKGKAANAKIKDALISRSLFSI